jgi:hypothetical protein
MTKTRLAYAVYDVRRAVTRQRSLSVNPENIIVGIRRDTVAVVVGGVTPTQGARESRVQGEGPQV